jgi:endonuclease/exonuclease/phosphatase family metal-dependent hydrolase
VDIFLLAECPLKEMRSILTAINAEHRGDYYLPHGVAAKVQVVSRLPRKQLVQRFTNPIRDMTIWTLRHSVSEVVLLAVVHLPSKMGGVTSEDQLAWVTDISRDIANTEDEDDCQNTVLVGDLNLNPYDPGTTSVLGLHGLMAKELMRATERKHRGRSYRCFYNPMWGLFGDRTPGPPGTYYWESSVPSNPHWHMLDQVLLRPALKDRLRNVQILAGDGYQSFLTNGTARKEHLSDHLPILFQLEL